MPRGIPLKCFIKQTLTFYSVQVTSAQLKMKALLIFALFQLGACHYVVDSGVIHDVEWQRFKEHYGKSYAGEEEILRRSIWQQRLDDITRHNYEVDAGLHSYRMGLNQFSDKTKEEMVRSINDDDSYPRIGMEWRPIYAEGLPDTLDWRDAGLVTPIKNQEPCGACWAFSATGSLEGQHRKKSGTLVALSEQNLIDCSTENDGCNGGDVNLSFEYVIKNRGIDTETSYPYTAKNGTCHFNKKSIGATCTGYLNVPDGDETP
ncbi:cathepsin S [Caerostris darwini]|uniref:Cathepsin S n=1 Tax=Caerostris darwini TaxID=1538125 RepID=A0AAV4TGC6_9ARAC|nr:cathepsin S [Caerostris darwini]